MALTQNDLVNAVTKLNELTRQKMINWQSSPASKPTLPAKNTFAPQFEANLSFAATHDGRILRITEYVAAEGMFGGGPIMRYVLDVSDEDGAANFEFPAVPGIRELFQSIRAQRLDIEGFIRNLVAE